VKAFGTVTLVGKGKRNSAAIWSVFNYAASETEIFNGLSQMFRLFSHT
jgi:hypothetical protein